MNIELIEAFEALGPNSLAGLVDEARGVNFLGILGQFAFDLQTTHERALEIAFQTYEQHGFGDDQNAQGWTVAQHLRDCQD